MNTYNLKTVQESVVINGNLSTTTYTIPVDIDNSIPNYLNKNRVIKEDKMLVFDTEQEYLDYFNVL